MRRIGYLAVCIVVALAVALLSGVSGAAEKEEKGDRTWQGAMGYQDDDTGFRYRDVSKRCRFANFARDQAPSWRQGS